MLYTNQAMVKRIVLLFVILAASAAAADEPGFTALFDGKTLAGWTLRGGHGPGYVVENGILVCPAEGGGNLFTEKEYSNFVFRFEFKMEPGGNNGVGVRAPADGDVAYTSMELQVLDDTAPQYKGLKPYQFHGSIYGVKPSHRGYQRPVGEWNFQEIVADGMHLQVILNGTHIIDEDLSQLKPVDGHEHPGLTRPKGYLGWAGHSDPVQFKNIRIKKLK